MKGLINIFEIAGTQSYPDDYRNFGPREEVEYQGTKYWLCDYKGDLDLIVVSYEDYLESIVPEQTEIPIVNIENLTVSGSQLVGNIYWNKLGTQITLQADCSLPDGKFMMMIEKVVEATQAVEDLRTPLTVENGKASAAFTFSESGNYVLKEERLNKGLDIIQAPFRVSLDSDIEFDVYVEQ